MCDTWSISCILCRRDFNISYFIFLSDRFWNLSFCQSKCKHDKLKISKPCFMDTFMIMGSRAAAESIDSSPLWQRLCQLGCRGRENVWTQVEHDKGPTRRYTEFSPHSQFAPFFSETFRPQLILGNDISPLPINRKDVSPPSSQFRKTFRTQTIFQKDVSHPNHILESFAPYSHNLERRFAPFS